MNARENVSQNVAAPSRSKLGWVVFLLMAGCLVMPAFANEKVAAASAPGQSLFAATNRARADQGLAPLRWDDALAAAARAHAEWIVQNGQLSHQYPGEASLASRAAQAGAHFQVVAENIAMGANAGQIQSEWMKSPPHRANILDPDLNAVGFGVVQRGGYLYAVADFDRNVSALTTEQTEAAIEKLLIGQNIQISGSRLDARQTCEMTHGAAGGSHPRFVMRWQNSDLSVLPTALQAELDTGRYRTAAVGACSSANAESAFTTYCIAVLLY
jgi:uncharacterized protein YkwD